MAEPDETELLAALAAGESARAIELALVRYGEELEQFLGVMLGDKQSAAEVFAEVQSDLVRGLDSFRGQSSVRAWLYGVARHAALRFLKDAFRRKRADAELDAVPLPLRSETPRYLRTDWKTRLRDLRATLPPDDRALLVLRIDREMDFGDIAHVLDDGVSAAALRKRFERIKARLVTLAERDGWFEDS